MIGGSASGALKTNLHYRSDKSENASKVCLSLVRAAGVNAGSFGGDEGYVEDGLTAIEV